MATAIDNKSALDLTEDNCAAIAKVETLARITAGLLIVLGLVGVVGGVAILFLGAGFLNALWCVVQGGLTLLMGLVMLAIAADLGYLARVPAFAKTHLKNSGLDLKFYFQLQLTLACVWGVVLVLRLLF